MRITHFWNSLFKQQRYGPDAGLTNASGSSKEAEAATARMISYAQNFEDVVLSRVFRKQRTGFYIDIGGYDPTIHSVTRHFYDRGWSGINIEPVGAFYEKFVRKRPRDLNLCTAVGDHEGTIEFHEWNNTGLSTADERFAAERLESLGFTKSIRTVPLTTLASICDQAVKKPIDFLKIDVEGLEKAVLIGGDWNEHRPRVVLVEAIQPIVPGDDPIDYTPTWPEWEKILFRNDYSFALFDGLNRFYYRNEEPAIKPLLEVPANVRDSFTQARTAA